ncbi:MAG: ParA family protein [Gammaproteobacteria bacterium]
MRTIMTLNTKGGSGKTTLATNLAGYYAEAGKKVALADYDRQHSSLEWLNQRPDYYAEITPIDGTAGNARPPRSTEILIMDAPAAVYGKELTELVKKAETLLIPVLPSPIDIRAAARFIQELLTVGKISRKQTKLAIVANRSREYTRVYQTLDAFLESLKIPFITTLRDSQNYIRAAEQGISIHEMAPSAVWQDEEQWEPLLKWLDSKRSRP